LSFANISKTDADDMAGHARFLAEPAANSFAAIEPYLKRSIPILIMIFLCGIFFLRGVSLMADRQDTEQAGKMFISLLASTAKGAVEEARSNGFAPTTGAEFEQILFRTMPNEATLEGRFVLITNEVGQVIGVRGGHQNFIGKDLPSLLDGGQPLFLFGESAGVQSVQLENTKHLAAAAKLGSGLAVVAVLQSEAFLFDVWRKRVSLDVTMFALTSTILIMLLYVYFGQISRGRAAREIYTETLKRVETALARGHCGLWDWDLANGRIFWSSSMFEMLGYQPLDDVLSFGEISPMVHPEDTDLFELAQKAAAQEITGVDEVIRMRHANGNYVRLRIRTELVGGQSSGSHLIGIAIDVTENHRLVELSNIASSNLKAAIESTSESFVLWDKNDRMVLCNQNYREYNGIPEHLAVPGISRAEIRTAMRAPLVDRRIPLDDGDDKSQTYEQQIEDGRWLQINERPTAAGGMISVGADITKLKLQEERLKESERRLMASIEDVTIERTKSQLKAVELADLNTRYLTAKDRAEAAYKAKTEFLANVSHELRTPLNAIIGFSEIMQAQMFGPLGSERYDEYANDIHTSGEFLLGVINDILEMSKIEAGRVVLEREMMDLRPLIEESTQMLSLQAKQKNIVVEQSIAKEMRIDGDRRAIRQILINLVSNAVKFTDNGGRIQIRAKTVSNAVHISIEDTGCGIPKCDLKRIGMPFEQVQNQFSKNHTGSGLGLAISRSLAQLHGGSLKIRSKVGKGTIVSLRIPLCDNSNVDEADLNDSDPLPQSDG
jgi:two-component system cell cycle sensor histidine kinase PleC